MTDNMEFIAAKDLPTTESTEVDVLCVENGELKLKAAANLGGNSTGGGYVIHVKPEEIDADSMPSGIIINSEESYDNYADLVFNGGSLWIDLSALGDPIMFQVTMATFSMEDGNLVVHLMSMLYMETLMMVVLNAPNGTWLPPMV